MIIFFESGRGGNQIFQYCALKRLSGGGALFIIGVKSLVALFDGVELAGAKRWESVVFRLCYRLGKERIARIAYKLHLITVITEQETPSGPRIAVHRGLFKKIIYCDTAYFQSERFIKPSIVRTLQVKRRFVEQATNIFATFPPDRSACFFVHVRRGDYVYWPEKSKPAVLPCKWYRDQMDVIRHEFRNPFFVVVSDDWPYVDEMFADCQDVFISRESEGVDFAIMTLCDGGVLSASSFSWWAAYCARLNRNAKYFVAPRLWAGHRQGQWYPAGMKSDWIQYVDVDEGDAGAPCVEPTGGAIKRCGYPSVQLRI